MDTSDAVAIATTLITYTIHTMAWTAGPIYPCNPATARSESTKLGVDPKGEKLIYTNGRAVIVGPLDKAELTSRSEI